MRCDLVLYIAGSVPDRTRGLTCRLGDVVVRCTAVGRLGFAGTGGVIPGLRGEECSYGYSWLQKVNSPWTLAPAGKSLGGQGCRLGDQDQIRVLE